MIRFCREPDVLDVDVIDMRLDAPQPYCRLNFDYQHGRIPVPGLSGMYSESVTGAYEGLRLVGKHGKPGKINCGYFVGPGRERSIKRSEWSPGWSFRGRCVDMIDARRLILVPSYLWVLSNVTATLLTKLRNLDSKRAIGLYDGETSGDFLAPERLSAAALLAAFLNGRFIEFRNGETIDH